MEIGPVSSTTALFAYMPHAFATVDAALQDCPPVMFRTLLDKVVQWRDEHGIRLSNDDCERLARWLNRTVYHLAE